MRQPTTGYSLLLSSSIVENDPRRHCFCGLQTLDEQHLTTSMLSVSHILYHVTRGNYNFWFPKSLMHYRSPVNTKTSRLLKRSKLPRAAMRFSALQRNLSVRPRPGQHFLMVTVAVASSWVDVFLFNVQRLLKQKEILCASQKNDESEQVFTARSKNLELFQQRGKNQALFQCCEAGIGFQSNTQRTCSNVVVQD